MPIALFLPLSRLQHFSFLRTTLNQKRQPASRENGKNHGHASAGHRVSESTTSIQEVGEIPEVYTTTGVHFDKYYPGYFGKVGMRYFHKFCNKFYCPIVNIDKLWSLIPQDVKAKSNKDAAPMIDMTQFGYLKVLGKGVLPENQSIIVKAKQMSKTVEKKIKEAGGAIVLTA